MEQKYFTGNMPLLTANHTIKTCCGPDDAFTSTTIFEKHGVKLAEELSETLHPEDPLGAPLPIVETYR